MISFVKSNSTVELFGSLLLVALSHHLVKRSITPSAFILTQHHWTMKICWQNIPGCVCVCLCISLYLNFIMCVSWWIRSSGLAPAIQELCSALMFARSRLVPAGSDRNNSPVRRTSSGRANVCLDSQSENTTRSFFSSQIWLKDKHLSCSVIRGGREEWREWTATSPLHSNTQYVESKCTWLSRF